MGAVSSLGEPRHHILVREPTGESRPKAASHLCAEQGGKGAIFSWCVPKK